jgi:hypothetical protein
MIMGAAIIDLAVIAWQAWQRYEEMSAQGPQAVSEAPDWKRMNSRRLWLWVVFWAVGIVLSGHFVLAQPGVLPPGRRSPLLSSSRW